MKRACLLLLVLGLTGCYEAGTWEDDPRNFERIFHDEKPADLVMVHSYYWRSRYFATEFSYFMQFQSNDEFRKGLFKNNQLKLPVTAKEKDGLFDFPKEKPDWFLPKPFAQYDAWIYADKPYSHFRIYIDKQAHDIFLSDYR